MGLFSKFKNKKNSSNSDLDVPPMPPPGLKEEFSEISQIDEELPKFDDIPKPDLNEKELVSSSKLPELKEEPMRGLGDLPELPPLDIPELKEEPFFPDLGVEKKEKRGLFGRKPKKKEKLPKLDNIKLESHGTEIPDDLAEFPELPPLSEEAPLEDIKDEPPLPQQFEKPEPKKIEEFKPKETHVIIEQKAKPKFISLPDFKDILSDMKTIKSELKSFDETIESFEEHKIKDQKLFNKWKSSLKDMEKKLNFTEKILFKG